MSERSFLHIVNGDATAEPLRQSGVPGAITVWADPLHEGQVPADVDDPRWREVRARELDGGGHASFTDVLGALAAWDAALAAYFAHDEVVIWLEHDLFDQLLLIRHLEWFALRDLGGTHLSLICIDRFPGVEPFHGLGQLSPRQLATLLGTRRAITPAQVELGRRAWSAFTASDPSGLQQLVDSDTSALPFLAGALRRLLEEYPAVRSGLPRTERHALEILSRGPSTRMALFRAVQTLEDRVFMGDTTFWGRLQGLANGPRPLIDMNGEVTVTDTGRRVLSGELDLVAMRGIEKWIGGVHLTGQAVRWRWDPMASRIVEG